MNLAEGFCRSRRRALSTCRLSGCVPRSTSVPMVRGWSIMPGHGWPGLRPAQEPKSRRPPNSWGSATPPHPNRNGEARSLLSEPRADRMRVPAMWCPTRWTVAAFSSCDAAPLLSRMPRTAGADGVGEARSPEKIHRLHSLTASFTPSAAPFVLGRGASAVWSAKQPRPGSSIAGAGSGSRVALEAKRRKIRAHAALLDPGAVCRSRQISTAVDSNGS
jgi:hypothetical protein